MKKVKNKCEKVPKSAIFFLSMDADVERVKVPSHVLLQVSNTHKPFMQLFY